MWSGPRNLSTAMMRSFSSRSDCAVIDEPFYAAYLDKTGLDHPMRAAVLKGERDGDVVARQLIGPVPEIRDPARVLASYKAKRDEVTLDDLGIRQQVEMFRVAKDPIVIDSADILADPEVALTKLCTAIGIEFDPAMLSWPEGPHACDGVWGQHWYGRIWASTGFAPMDESPRPNVGRPEIMEPAMEIYDAMRAVRLR